VAPARRARRTRRLTRWLAGAGLLTLPACATPATDPPARLAPPL